MLGFLKRHRGLVIVGLLLTFPLILLYIQTKRPAGRGPVVGTLVDISALIERGLLFVVGGISDGIEHYVLSVSSWDELTRLRRERSSAEHLTVQVAELTHQNEELRALLRAAAPIDRPRALGARVVARTGAPLSRLITVDKGSKDGVRRGDGVISKDGIVGVVLVAGRFASDVLLVSDASSAVDVVVQRSRARGLLRGVGNDERYHARVEDFDRLHDVRAGDRVITSGLGARFPPGLPVGTLMNVSTRDNSLTLDAEVKPATDLSRVEYVAVLIGREVPSAPELGRELEDDTLVGPAVRSPRPKKAPPPLPRPGEVQADAGPQGDAGVSGTSTTADGGLVAALPDAGTPSLFVADGGVAGEQRPAGPPVDAGTTPPPSSPPPSLPPSPPPPPPIEPRADGGVL